MAEPLSFARAPGSRWPEHLWIVRHGESAGNIARDAANAAGAQRIELTARDVDIPLSPRAFQHWDGEWKSEPGAFVLEAGRSIADLRVTGTWS